MRECAVPAPVVRGRFAPSPSGRMHLGNVWCALLAWLSVRSQQGVMVLRIEDLDTGRCRPEYADRLMDDLRWLGLDWDEGPGAAQPDGPYYQSQCAPLYRRALEQVAGAARVYPCYCSRADLHAASAPHRADGTVLYAGRCRNLDAEQRAQLEAAGRRPALRVTVPDRDVAFTDGLCGPMTQNLARECGDFLLRRSDGVFAYQLAVVTDDGRMDINQVVRGRDLLDSTPRQIWLQECLGLPRPAYYHTPLLCAPDGRRLSKREKDLDMGALRSRFSPRQLTGRLAALAGLVPPGTQCTPAELVDVFDWNKIGRDDVLISDW